MHVEVPTVPRDQLLRKKDPDIETSAIVQQRVEAARRRQLTRSGSANHALTNKQIEKVCVFDDGSRQFLDQAMTRLGLSARAYHRVIKVARTIADLAGDQDLTTTHLGEALQYRCLDRTTALH